MSWKEQEAYRRLNYGQRLDSLTNERGTLRGIDPRLPLHAYFGATPKPLPPLRKKRARRS